jgi:ABC-type antimicrobial peptide transport system permease subunit
LHEIVGVSRDTKVQTLGEEAEPFLFTPLLDRHASLTMVVARSRGGNQGLTALLRSSINQLDPNVAIFDALTFQDHIGILVYPFRMAARLGSFLGLATLALVVIGLYGLVALNVSQRLREFGIRVALGARSPDLVRLMLRDVAWLLAGSIALGLAAAVGISRVLAGFVFGIGALDPLTFAAVPLLLAAITLVAAGIPLRSALKTDPSRLLRVN